MKKLCIFLLGFIPLGLGLLMDKLMWAFPDALPHYMLTAIGVLVFWVFLSFFVGRLNESPRATFLLINAPAAIVLVLHLFQLIVLGQYWNNWFGNTLQFFYMPLLNLGGKFTFLGGGMLTAYCASFLLLCAASYCGIIYRKKYYH